MLHHSVIKTSYALGIQEQVLPDSFIQKIPRSTSARWKDLNPDSFVGSELANQIEVDLEQVKIILDKRAKKIKNAFVAFTHLYLIMLDFIGRNNFEKLILQNKETVINLVDNLPSEFSRNLVYHFLQISEHQFKIWKNNRRFACPLSLIGYCTKRFPTQISQKEINILKSFMSRKRFSTWSIAAVWGFVFIEAPPLRGIRDAKTRLVTSTKKL